MNLPALLLSKEHLRKTWQTAGEGATLELPEHGLVESEALADLSCDALVGAKLCAPGVTLTLGRDAFSTHLVFEDSDEASQLAESILKTLEPCARRRTVFTHTDGAIMAGLLLPLGAGHLAPASSVKIACAGASLLWLIYLLWVQRNARSRWCVFAEES